MLSPVFHQSNMDCLDFFSEYSVNSKQDEASDISETTMNTSLNSSFGEVEFDSTINDSGISCSEDSVNCCEDSSIVKTNSLGSRKRKNYEPCRSSPANDPNFRGVTIRMENKRVDSDWKLVMHPTFSLSPRKKRKFRAYVDSSDEEEINNNYTPIIEEKHCASCSVKKTPLWRDAEDGTPLCNACGIRYKKYKLRCGTCWHIPKKDEFRPTCQYCGSFYEYIYPRR